MSGRTPARRRTACASPGPRGPTSPRSSRCSPTRPAGRGARSRHSPRAPRGAPAPTRTAPSNRLWRVTDSQAIAEVVETLGAAELLIADGHHRYETARVYAEEIGGEGPHRYVLMCLVALQDPGPHGVPHPPPDQRPRPTHGASALAEAIAADFEITELATTGELTPPAGPAGPDRLHRRRLPAPAAADAEGPGDRRPGAARSRRALPPARHGGARGADPEGRAGDDRRRHRPPQRPRVRA